MAENEVNKGRWSKVDHRRWMAGNEWSEMDSQISNQTIKPTGNQSDNLVDTHKLCSTLLFGFEIDMI